MLVDVDVLVDVLVEVEVVEVDVLVEVDVEVLVLVDVLVLVEVEVLVDVLVLVDVDVVDQGGQVLVLGPGGDDEFAAGGIAGRRQQAAPDVIAGGGQVPAVLPDHQPVVVKAVQGDLGLALIAGGGADGLSIGCPLESTRSVHTLSIDVIIAASVVKPGDDRTSYSV